MTCSLTCLAVDACSQPVRGYFNGHKSSTYKSDKRPKKNKEYEDIHEEKCKVLLWISISRKDYISEFKKILKNPNTFILLMLTRNLTVMLTKTNTGFFSSGKAS